MARERDTHAQKRLMSFLLHLPSPVLLRSHFPLRVYSCCMKNKGDKTGQGMRGGGGGEKKGNTLYLLLRPNGASQHEGKTLQFPIPKSNRRSLKPSLSSAVSQITFANSISSKHTFHTKTVAKHNPGLHFHSNNLNPGDSYQRSPGADFFPFLCPSAFISVCMCVSFLSFSLLFFFPSTCAYVNRRPKLNYSTTEIVRAAVH